MAFLSRETNSGEGNEAEGHFVLNWSRFLKERYISRKLVLKLGLYL